MCGELPPTEVRIALTRHSVIAAAMLLCAALTWGSDGPQVGPPQVLADDGGYESCRFLGADAPGGPALIVGRLNAPAFAREIVRLPLDGGEAEVLALGRDPDVRSSMLAWVGTEPGEEGIWLRDLATDAAPQHLHEGLELTDPSIAVDGRTIACTYTANNRTGIFLLRPGQARPERLAYRDERSPVYSPDGGRMLIIKNDQVWLMTARRWEEVVETRLTDVLHHADPAWGPRGEWIVFAAGWTEQDARVGIMRLSSRQITRPELGITGVRSPVISPDGTKLAFIAGRDETATVHLCDMRLPE